MYRFFIKNYMDGSDIVSSETEVYSVPIMKPETAFDDPNIKMEVGKAGSFEFGVNPGHPFFSAWLKLKTILRVEYDGDTIFRGRVLTSDNNDLTGERKIHAEGDLAFLLDSQVEGTPDDNRSEISAIQYLEQLISNHNSQMSEDPDKQITLGEVPGRYTEITSDDQRVKTDNRKYGSSSWQSTMSALEELQKVFGGFFRTRYDNGICYLDWLESYFRSSTHTQPLEITDNLREISDTEEVDNTFTVLIPVGSFESKPLYLPNRYLKVTDIDKYCTDDQLNSGYHRKEDYLNAFKDHGWVYKVEQFRNADTVEKLQEYAVDYILHNYVGSIKSFTISAIDMHHIDSNTEKYLIGDKVPVIYPDSDNLINGHSGRISKTLTITFVTYRPHNPEENEYFVGIPNTVISKEYGTAAKKKISSSNSASGNYASSGITGLQDLMAAQPQNVFEVMQESKNYNALAWAFIQDNTGKNYYQHNAYNNLISAYPNAESEWQVSKIGYMLIHNKMSTGNYGRFDYGYFTVDATGGQTKVYIRNGVEATNELKWVLPYLANYLQSLKVGYEAYAAAHPGWPENSASTVVTTLLDGNGLNFLTTGLGSLKLPEGLDILGADGEGFDISGVLSNTVMTDLLGQMGLPIPGQDQYKPVDLIPGDNPQALGYYEYANGDYALTHDDRGVPGKTYYEKIAQSNVLSEFDMQKILNMSSPLGSILDSMTGKFNLDNLKKILPSNLKDSITNGTFSKQATDWLKQKFPILKYILGDGQTQLSVDSIENFVNSIPLFAPEKQVAIDADGGVRTDAGLNVGGTASIDSSGTITLKSGLASLLDASGHVTKESFLAVFPKMESSFVKTASVPTLTTAASNEVIKKFPELAGSVNSNKRLTLSAIEAKINSLAEDGKLKNTVEPTVKLNPNTGAVNSSELNLGQNGTGDSPTVKLDGNNATVKVGREVNDRWTITINEPIKYMDENGTEHTINGAIKANDFSLPTIPSFHTKIAVIDGLFADQAIFNSTTTETLEAHSGLIGDLQTQKVSTTDLYVGGDSDFALYIDAPGVYNASELDFAVNGIGLQLNPNAVYTYKPLYTEGGLHVSNGDSDILYTDGNFKLHGYFSDLYVTSTRNESGYADVANAIVSFETAQENNGQFIIPTKKLSGGDGPSINFNIAASQTYINGVAASYNDAKGRVSWPQSTSNDKSSFSIAVPGDYNTESKTGTTNIRLFFLTVDASNGVAKLEMKHSTNGGSVSDGYVAQVSFTKASDYEKIGWDDGLENVALWFKNPSVGQNGQEQVIPTDSGNAVVLPADSTIPIYVKYRNYSENAVSTKITGYLKTPAASGGSHHPGIYDTEDGSGGQISGPYPISGPTELWAMCGGKVSSKLIVQPSGGGTTPTPTPSGSHSISYSGAASYNSFYGNVDKEFNADTSKKMFLVTVKCGDATSILKINLN